MMIFMVYACLFFEYISTVCSANFCNKWMHMGILYIYMVYTYINIYTWWYIYIYTWWYIYIYTWLSMYINIHTHAYIRIFIFLHIGASFSHNAAMSHSFAKINDKMSVSPSFSLGHRQGCYRGRSQLGWSPIDEYHPQLTGWVETNPLISYSLVICYSHGK